jgi:HlyD family secretion protein
MPLDKDTLDQLKIDRTDTGGGSRAVLWVLVGVVIVVLLAGGGWWLSRPGPVAVRTAVARSVTEAGGSRTLLNASGYVTARRLATVSSKVTGRVVEVMIEEGMSVAEGQVLARLDSTNVEANLRLVQAQAEAARSGLGETEALLEEASRNLLRTESLASAAVAARAELDRARSERDALQARLLRQRAEVTVAERQVALWQQQLDDTIIRAPYAGVVVSKNAQAGEMISPISAGGGFTRTGICTIVDMTSLEVEVDVNESYINRVSAGQPVVVTLDSYPDWQIAARVIAIVPTADRQKATVRVRVGFDELDARILPDMGLKVAFQSTESAAPTSSSIVVPRTAVQRVDGRDVVWVISNGRAERRAVSVRAVGDSETTIETGLRTGERVVVEGHSGLGEGSRVTEDSP